MSSQPHEVAGAEERLPHSPDGASGTMSRPGLASWFRGFRRTTDASILVVFVAIQVVCIAAALIAPNEFRYLSGPNISVMLQAIPSLGIVALGVGVLMIAGEFDLSVGTAATFVSVVAAMLMNDLSVPVWIASAVAIVLGTLIGALNGLITLQFAMPSFIVTLGGLLFWHGMTFLVHGAQSIGFRPEPVFQFVFGGSLGTGRHQLCVADPLLCRLPYDASASPPGKSDFRGRRAIATRPPRSASRRARSN